MLLRTTVLAIAAVLSWATRDALSERRPALAATTPPPRVDYLAVSGDRVLVARGGTADGSRGSDVTLHRFDVAGAPGVPVPMPAPKRVVEQLVMAGDTMAAMLRPTEATPRRAASGIIGAPLRVIDGLPQSVAVAERRAYVLHGTLRDRGWIESVPVRGGRSRHLNLPGRRFGVLKAAGRYVAVINRFAVYHGERIVVLDGRTGRVVTRLGPSDFESYGVDARGSVTVLTQQRHAVLVRRADRGHRRLRAIARVPNAYGFGAVADGRAVLIEQDDPNGPLRLGLVDRGGRHTLLARDLPAADNLAFDGRTAVFSAGPCVFAIRRDEPVRAVIGPPDGGTCENPVFHP